ncbi:ExbD/TolR family protein [Denitratisoma oestradiolicum]|uniref:Biopolymer transporter ExbD n=1 Tax=Denitratisoma oestradiolicum TaxID=311182 RepID=A0A6S6XV70_9PROT|nr:biopolymer transporter ExbD [Denitratisoma oestradiolicum]TWO81245.1 biopolymer transporter ExbD [Denitratisoma oestradiolicum]CAB1367947.1 Biopolymer transporter ExbD [Denitratisoma oestradiolicum]
MGMNVGSSSGKDLDVVVDINTTPLIDVMLVLLIMLIITIPIQTHAVKINMPVNTPPKVDKPPIIVKLNVDADGTIHWNDTVIPDRSTLEVTFRQMLTEPEIPEIHLRPDRAAQYKVVAMIMATAQRLGVTKIGIVGGEQFM